MDDEKLDAMLVEATRTLRPGKLLAFSRTILKVRRTAERNNRRYPPLDQFTDKLDQIAEILGMDYR
jgi:hypothetical protein